MPPKAKQQGWQPLFTTEKNAPILFWIPPHKKEHEQRRAELRDLIEVGRVEHCSVNGRAEEWRKAREHA